jgi:hypothetical protein
MTNRQPKGTPVGGQFAEGRKPEGGDLEVSSTSVEPLKKKISFGKVDGYGNGRKNCSVDVQVSISENNEGQARLSIQGNVWNAGHTDIISGGQNVDEMLRLVDDPKMREIAEVWKRWHLNDMRAGCEHQRTQSKGSVEVGQECPECSYRYGSAWLYEELPPEIIEQVRSW